MTPFPQVIDASQRADFATCPQKWYLKYIRGLNTDHESTHLLAGSAFADAFYAYRMAIMAGESFDDARIKGFTALTKTYGPHIPNPNNPRESAKNLANVQKAFISATEHWHPSQDFFEVTDAEISFTIPIPGIKHPDTGEDVCYGGRLDAYGTIKPANGQPLKAFLDDKTTYEMGPSWVQQWDLRSQFTGYTWGLRAYGYTVDAALIRGTAIQVKQIKHEQVLIYRPDFMVARWEDRMIADVKRMIEYYRANHFPNSGEESGACASFGGCMYQSRCQSATPEAYDSNFVIKFWRPYEQEAE